MHDSLANGDEIVDKLKAEFAGDPIGVNAIKQDTLDSAELASSAFTTLFVVFGLFSIGVGILLIILIFSMLAAERRSEMGMARAVGAQRAQLVQQFLSEGTVYALLAGLVGAFLGVGAAYLIAFALGKLFGDFFDIEPYVSPRSMVVAYCLGVVITFIAVVYASIRNSRLNIVAAIRDIPDVSSPVRKKRTLIFGALAVLIGALLTFVGLNGNSAFAAYAGLSILPFGVALLPPVFRGFEPTGLFDRRSLSDRPLAPPRYRFRPSIFGELNGDIEMFFLSGVFLVAGVDDADRPESRCAARTRQPDRRSLRWSIAVGAHRDRLPGRYPIAHWHDDRHVQPDHLLAGHVQHDQRELLQRLPRRRSECRLGCAGRSGRREPNWNQ